MDQVLAQASANGGNHGHGSVRITVLTCMAVGTLCILGFGAQTPHFWQTVSVGLLVAASALVVGGTIGFLFGIPRALDGVGGQRPQPERVSTGDNGDEERVGYHVNTNLQQISDWLTKILVGVTLTQIVPIYEGFTTLANQIGAALQPGQALPIAVVFAGGILVYFLVGGFLLGYLGTRIYLPDIFAGADASAFRVLKREVTASVQKSVRKTIEAQWEPLEQEVRKTIGTTIDAKERELEAQRQHDIKTFELVDIQLSNTHKPCSTEEDITEAVKNASPQTQEQLFQLAKEVRKQAWRMKGPQWREWVARTVPVFRGLVQSARWEQRHRVYAQLGYALKDKSPPEWDLACRYLEKAIAISKELDAPVPPHFSFNWALCRVAIEERDNPKRQSEPDLKEEIIAALRHGMEFATLRDALIHAKIEDTQRVQAWMERNGIDLGALGIARDNNVSARRARPIASVTHNGRVAVQ